MLAFPIPQRLGIELPIDVDDELLSAIPLDIAISLGAYAEIVRTAASRLEDETFGLGKYPMPPGTFRCICRALAHCPTLDEAFDLFNGFFGRFLGDAPFSRSGREVRLHTYSGAQERSPLFEYAMVLCLYKLLCWLSGRKITLAFVEFKEPEHLAGAFFGCLFGRAAGFGAERAGFMTVNDVWASPVVKSSAAAAEFGGGVAWLFAWSHDEDIARLVREQLTGSQFGEFPGFGELASGLGMSAATLSRKLRAAGLTYRAIKDEYLADEAIALVLKTDSAIEWVAKALGFADQSSFSRAFKRWTGMRPGEYRRMKWVRVGAEGS